MRIIYKKNKERLQKFKDTGDSQYIYQKKLEKVRFQHDMAYGDIKDLTRRIDLTSDKILRDKTFSTLLKIQNMMHMKGVLLK